MTNYIRNFSNAFINWCADTSDAARFERTIMQGIMAALIAGVVSGEWGIAFTTAMIMAVLSPIQAAIGHANDEDDE